MQRRSLLVLGAVSPLALFFSRYLAARKPKALSPADAQAASQKLNDLASSIKTPADAQHLVDLVAERFVDILPPAFATARLRAQVAHAEFLTATDPHQLIAESRVADVWNAYASRIQAPREFQVSPDELHNLRDAFLISARTSWESGNRNIWSAPAIYATRSDGSLAPGCRAIESIRLLWDFANMPDNLRAARERVQKGVLISELVQQMPPSTAHGGAVVVRIGSGNPVEAAERKFVQQNGWKAFNRALTTMLDDTLA